MPELRKPSVRDRCRAAGLQPGPGEPAPRWPLEAGHRHPSDPSRLSSSAVLVIVQRGSRRQRL